MRNINSLSVRLLISSIRQMEGMAGVRVKDDGRRDRKEWEVFTGPLKKCLRFCRSVAKLSGLFDGLGLFDPNSLIAEDRVHVHLPR